MNEYVEYKSTLCSLKNLLGLGCIHLYTRDELMPYITRILGKINEWLVLEDKSELSENVKLFISYYEDGMDKLIGPDRLEELFKDYDYSSDNENFVQEYFINAWTNIYTTIYLELLYNYSYLFTTAATDCHECCGTIGEDSEGNLVYNTTSGNLSSSHVNCGCSK